MKTPQARGAHERTCKGSADLTKAAYKEKRNEDLREKREAATGGSSGNYPCSVCNRSCQTLAGLKSHMRRHERLETVESVPGSVREDPVEIQNEPEQETNEAIVPKKKREPEMNEDGQPVYFCMKRCGKSSTKAGSIARHEKACKNRPEPEPPPL